MPLLAIQEVLGFVFMPFIDLFRTCGIPCCFCDSAPGLCQGNIIDDDGCDDGYDEGSDDDYYDEEKEEVWSFEAHSLCLAWI